MRLYLSSFRVGDHPDELRRLVPPPGPLALVGNAVDGLAAEERARSLDVDREQLGALGYDVGELDLRDHAGESGASVRDALASYAGVYVRGGNVFVLREALRRSGADRVLVELLRADAIGYAGYSAGPCVLAPSLAGLEACDPVSDLARAHADDPAPEWSGLGLLDRAVVPHLDSPGHPETGVLAEVARRFTAERRPFWSLRDGDVLVVDGSRAGVLPRRHDRPRGRTGD